MAVALDTSSMSAGGSGGTSRTWSHTCTGSDLALFVNPWHYDGNSYISGVTYAGASMTLSGSHNVRVSIYQKTAPATGANNVVISSSNYATVLGGGASSWAGVDQTTPLSGQVTNSGSGYGTPVSTTSVTCPANGAVLGAVWHNYSNLGINTGTEFGNYHSGGGGWEYAFGYRTSTGEIKWNNANNYTFYTIAAGIEPVAAAGFVRPQIATIMDAVHRASNW